MGWIIGSGLRFGRLVVALAIGLLVIGIAQLRSAPADVYPEFQPPSVEIQTEALGLSAAEVEQLITVPLEQDLLNGVPWLDKIHSASMPGLSAIDLTFQPGTNLYAARQMVQERMTQAHALPNVGSPPIMIQPLSAVGRVAMIRLSSRQVSLIDMSVLARWQIKPRLMGVHGVANVSIYGQRDRQLQVQVDPRQLAASHVSLTQMIETAGNALWVSPLTFVEASTPGTGGFYESAGQRVAIQHVSPISTPAQLSSVPVEGAGEHGPRLGDVSHVIVDHQPLIGDAVSGGAPSLMLVIEKFPGANTLQVTHDIETAMSAMAPGLKGITVDMTGYRPATFLGTALHNTGWVALAGLALLLLVLGLAVSWRAAVIGLVTVPVSIVAAAYVLYLRGNSITTITLLGLAAAVCIVIDDVINDVAAIRRGIAAHQSINGDAGLPLNDAIRSSVAAVRGPLVLATVAIGVATMPFIVLGHVVTAFSGPLVLTYALAVLASMVVAFLLTPTLGLWLLRGEAPGRDRRFARWVTLMFDRGFAVVSRPRWAWAAAGVIAAVTAAMIPLQAGHGTLLPQLQDRNLLVRVSAAPGTSLPEMERVTAAVDRDLQAVPGVQGVGTHVGRAVGSDQLVDVNSAEMWVTLTGQADYSRSRAAITAVLHGYPGLRADVGTYPDDQVAQLLAAQRDDLIVRVYGSDIPTLTAKARQIRALVAGIPGVAHPAVRPMPTEPVVDIKVDLATAERYGLRPGDVRRDATTLTSGLIVGSLYEQSKIYDVVVWGQPQVRSNLTELRNLLIDTPSGRQLRLGDVATLTVRPEPTAIIHDDVLRSLDVTAAVTGDPAAVTAAVRTALAKVQMPYEYHAEVLGNATIRQGDDLRGLAYGAVALVAALLLLQAGVGRWRRAWLALASLPLSVAGGLLTALITGGAWSVASLAGLFTVLALAIRASVLLGRRVLSAEGAAEGDARKAIRVAARERAVPLAQTVVTTAAFIAPAVVAGTLPGLEFLHPLAVTMLGGLVSLVIIQMLVLPAFLVLVTPRSREGALAAPGVQGPLDPTLTVASADGQPPGTRS
ncbi:MAG TPA: efflux RND transporter permease subunit [Trebonia sp.]